MKEFVLLELYTDGTDAASEANQKLEDSKFQTIAIPFYAIVDPDEKVVASFPGLTKNPQEYLAFPEEGSAGQSFLIDLSCFCLLVPALIYAADSSLRGFPPKEAQQEREWEAKARAIPQPDRIREYIQRMSERPHHAGSPGSKAIAEYAARTAARLGSRRVDRRVRSAAALRPPCASWK